MATKSSSRSSNSDTSLVRELAKILNDKDLSEIEMEKGALRIRVARQSTALAHHVQTATPVVATPALGAATHTPEPEVPTPATPQAESAADVASDPGTVKSPMVGTAYTRPSPDADPFFKVGDMVKEGDTVVLVEAMKTFNPITAAKSGKITAIFVDDAQPVEFGEPLFTIA